MLLTFIENNSIKKNNNFKKRVKAKKKLKKLLEMTCASLHFFNNNQQVIFIDLNLLLSSRYSDN